MMKKLLHRDIRGNNPRKHEVSIEETMDHSDTKISKRKTYKYFIRDHYTSLDQKELKKWICTKQKVLCKKNCHIIKLSNSHTGEKKIVCKILGDFFVVWENTAYDIVYINKIRLRIAPEHRREA